MAFNLDKWDYKQTPANAAQENAIKTHLNRVFEEHKNGWRIR